MPNFVFNCPHCNQSLDAPEEILGQQINCPSCDGLIQLPVPDSGPQQSAIQPPPLPSQTTTEQINGRPVFSPDSPDGAIDSKLLATFLSELNFTSDEELFFFHQTLTPAIELAGFKKPNYNLMVSSRRVCGIAKDKTGKTSIHEYALEKMKGVEVSRLLVMDSVEFITDDSTGQLCKYNFAFPPTMMPAFKEFNREYLPAIAAYIEQRIPDAQPMTSQTSASSDTPFGSVDSSLVFDFRSHVLLFRQNIGDNAFIQFLYSEHGKNLKEGAINWLGIMEWQRNELIDELLTTMREFHRDGSPVILGLESLKDNATATKALEYLKRTI